MSVFFLKHCFFQHKGTSRTHELHVMNMERLRDVEHRAATNSPH